MVNTCNVVGKDPPSPENCSGEGWFKKENYDEQTGIHTITIPKDGTGSYIIEAAGAVGGTIRDAEENNIEISPGRGAIVKGIFYLKEGEKYNIIVGQKGTTPKKQGTNPWNGGAGGWWDFYVVRWQFKAINSSRWWWSSCNRSQDERFWRWFFKRSTMGPYIKKHMVFQIQQMFRIILV